MSKRRFRLALVAAVGVPVLVWRAYREYRPAEATWNPPLWSLSYAPVEGGEFRSKDGHRVSVVFHDFGAAQSGNYWTWVISDHWLTGKRVVAEGYSSTDVRNGEVPFPLRWNSDASLTVEFMAHRYGDQRMTKTARLH